MRIVDNISPSGLALNTQAQLNDPGITYNQASITYDNALYTYGGAYGYEDISPSFALASLLRPSLNVNQTNQQLLDQGITFNQANVSYDDTRYDYGGLYGYADIKPLISRATSPQPRIVNYADIYTNIMPPAFAGIPLGPGFFLFVPQ